MPNGSNINHHYCYDMYKDCDFLQNKKNDKTEL